MATAHSFTPEQDRCLCTFLNSPPQHPDSEADLHWEDAVSKFNARFKVTLTEDELWDRFKDLETRKDSIYLEVFGDRPAEARFRELIDVLTMDLTEKDAKKLISTFRSTLGAEEVEVLDNVLRRHTHGTA